MINNNEMMDERSGVVDVKFLLCEINNERDYRQLNGVSASETQSDKDYYKDDK